MTNWDLGCLLRKFLLLEASVESLEMQFIGIYAEGVGGLAQLGERYAGSVEVKGPNPLSSTNVEETLLVRIRNSFTY